MSDIALLSTLPDFPQTNTGRNPVSVNIFAQPRRNPNLAKWNILFDKKGTEWISFKPKLGLQVYPCYACRNMFGSKNSFLDHVNRRGILLKYKCSYCAHRDPWVFYNPCALLMHTRQHYTLLGGQINLECLEVSVIPYGLAGFLPNPNIAMLYDVEADNLGETMFINSRFYSPVNQCMGNPIVNLLPNELLFYYSDESTREVTSLTLRQMSSNIPRCRFVLLENNYFTSGLANLDFINDRMLQPGESCIVSIKEETPYHAVSEVNGPASEPVPAKEKSQTSRPTLKFTKCPECHQAQNGTMSEHFLETNHPFLQSLRCNICKYIAPTKCSLQAHERIHGNLPPFVCPECGRDFPHWQQLNEHMHEVCFHLTKQVRIRCTGKRCGKIFAQMVTFSSHFLLHVKVWLQCSLCNEIMYDELAFLEHNSLHEVKHPPVKVFKCEVCPNSDEVFTHDTLQDHIRQHAVNKFLYVYICKSCHSYFRSPATYATHLLRCTRLISPQVNPNLIAHQRLLLSDKTSFCLKCVMNIKPQLKDNLNICPRCGSAINMTTVDTDTSEADPTYCPLCDEELILSEIEEHTQNRCRYSNPVIVLNDCGSNEHVVIKEELISPNLNNRKKRRKSQHSSSKSREMSTSNSEPDLSIDLDEIVPFDGIYRCKVCNYHNVVRETFHDHIINHRTMATAYQCMECGECFVVKPSLSKHLLIYHQICDADKYFEENNCFNKRAIEELENMMRLAPCETRDPVEKNQCTVCLCKFNDEVELAKHFRTHGMAFLMRNSK